MGTMLPELDWLSILLCSLLGLTLRGLWYSPWGFRRFWLRERGLDAAVASPSRPLRWVPISLLALGGLNTLLALVVGFAANLQGALQLALGLWLGFGLLLRVPEVAFEGRGLRIWLVQAGFDLVLVGLSTVFMFLLQPQSLG